MQILYTIYGLLLLELNLKPYQSKIPSELGKHLILIIHHVTYTLHYGTFSIDGKIILLPDLEKLRHLALISLKKVIS